MKLETQRLVLRDLEFRDLPALQGILGDPLVMWAYGAPFSESEVAAWLERQLANYHEYGHGLWAVVLRTTNTMIGECGITYQDIDGERLPEVGYHFNKDYWHQGYATEAAKACQDWAFQNLPIDTLYAQVRDTNTASINVAIRLGMTIQKSFKKTYKGQEIPHELLSVKTPTPQQQ